MLLTWCMARVLHLPSRKFQTQHWGIYNCTIFAAAKNLCKNFTLSAHWMHKVKKWQSVNSLKYLTLSKFFRYYWLWSTLLRRLANTPISTSHSHVISLRASQQLRAWAWWPLPYLLSLYSTLGSRDLGQQQPTAQQQKF